MAHLIRRVPTMVDASNAECTQSVFKFMSADTDGDGGLLLVTDCVAARLADTDGDGGLLPLRVRAEQGNAAPEDASHKNA